MLGWRSKIHQYESADFVLLKLTPLPNAGLPPFDFADCLSLIHGLLLGDRRSWLSGELAPQLAFEGRRNHKAIEYYLWLSRPLLPAIKRTLSAYYPALVLSETASDYSRPVKSNSVFCSTESTGSQIKPAYNLASLTSRLHSAGHRALAGFNPKMGELWFQLVLRPAGQNPELFKAKLRLACAGTDQRNARLGLEMAAIHFQNLKLRGVSTNPDKQFEYNARLFIDKGLEVNNRAAADLFSLADITANISTDSRIENRPSGPKQPPGAFEKLIIEAEARPRSSKVKSKTKAKVKTTIKTRRSKPPKGMLKITAKAIAKQDIGKLATKKSNSTADDDLVIKLH